MGASNSECVVDGLGADSAGCRDTESLEWRLDQTLSSATTKRQQAALECLPRLELNTASEQRVRCVVLGIDRCAQLASLENSWAGCAPAASRSPLNLTVPSQLYEPALRLWWRTLPEGSDRSAWLVGPAVTCCCRMNDRR